MPARYSSGSTPVLSRWIDALHALPVRVFAGFLDDLITRCPKSRVHIDLLLSRYAEAEPEVLRLSGADRWPPIVRLVPPDDDPESGS